MISTDIAKEWEVDDVSDNQRLDTALGLYTERSRSVIQKWIKEGLVQVNGKIAKSSQLVHENDHVFYHEKDDSPSPLQPEDIPITIIYEDDDILLVDKPAGLVVHPGAGNLTGTLVNALLFQQKALSTFQEALRPGIVHRLDKDTTGIMVIAKNNQAHERLAKQIQDRKVTKKYYALVEGYVPEDEGTLDYPIGHDAVHWKKRAVVALEKGKECITHYRVIFRANNKTLVEVTPHTGRTHQIRVHFDHIGHAVVGDPLYGKADGNRQLLHAHSLEFNHPTSGKRVMFKTELPKWAKAYIQLAEAALAKNETAL